MMRGECEGHLGDTVPKRELVVNGSAGGAPEPRLRACPKAGGAPPHSIIGPNPLLYKGLGSGATFFAKTRFRKKFGVIEKRRLLPCRLTGCTGPPLYETAFRSFLPKRRNAAASSAAEAPR